MSLILEALKRAERERKRKQTPDLRSVLQDSKSGRRRLRPWFSLLCIVLLAIVIVLAAVFWPKEPARLTGPVEDKKADQKVQKPSLPSENPFAMLSRSTSTSKAMGSQAGREAFQELARSLGEEKAGSAEQSSDAGRIDSAVDEKAEVDESKSIRDIVTAGNRLPGDGAKAFAKKKPGKKRKRPPAVVEARKDDASGPVRSQEPEATGASQALDTSEEAAGPVVSPESIPTIYELPQDIQQKLEGLSLNVHAYYDDPDKRFVYINMKRYQVGDRIGDKTGPLLEEITPEGVIIDYGGGKAKLLTTR